MATKTSVKAYLGEYLQLMAIFFPQSRGWANERHVTGASSKRPAQLAGLYPRKGRLNIGADADLVLWAESDRNRPVFTIVGGRVAVQYGQLRSTTARDRESGNAIKAGYLAPAQTPCAMLAAVQDRVSEHTVDMHFTRSSTVFLNVYSQLQMKELCKRMKPVIDAQFMTQHVPTPTEEISKKMEGIKITPAGDAIPAGLPTREMRTIASQYKRNSLVSSFKLNGECMRSFRALFIILCIPEGVILKERSSINGEASQTALFAFNRISRWRGFTWYKMCPFTPRRLHTHPTMCHYCRH